MGWFVGDNSPGAGGSGDMKIALYIEDGLEQIVLTPETETEKGIVGKMHDNSRTLSIYRGGFYPCMGGWTRHYNTCLLYTSPSPRDA